MICTSGYGTITRLIFSKIVQEWIIITHLLNKKKKKKKHTFIFEREC